MSDAPPPVLRGVRRELAPFAVEAAGTRGRQYPEPASATRTAFQRDRDRIVHAAAFRRLQGKTQVFVTDAGDHFRTRLTHTLEVAQIARSLSRALGLDEDLAEAIALAHDLGHPPFGHAGEAALAEAMSAYDGFDHNEQTFRIVTRLEGRYAAFDGLNLSWETLEGLAKHNGPLDDDGAAEPPGFIRRFSRRWDLELASWPSAEAQVAALADDIAYNAHDLDDGVRSGLLSLGDIAAVPWVAETLSEVEGACGRLEPRRLIHETVRRLIDAMVNDLLAETARRLCDGRVASAAEVRALARPAVAFSGAMGQKMAALKAFLFERLYRHPSVSATMAEARLVVAELFRLRIGAGPRDGKRGGSTLKPTEAEVARLAADYIAGMTDRFALAEYRRHFGRNLQHL